MDQPDGFSWIEKPLLAAMARPRSQDDLAWLRLQGIELLISLTEDPVHRYWINEVGLMNMHVPIVDMEAPSQEDLYKSITAILKLQEKEMGVAVHCEAGLGRTGVVLACYFVEKGLGAQKAIAKIRRLRPGSVETEAQAEAVVDYARRRHQS